MVSTGFVITSLIVILIPGTGVIYTVTTGLSGSRKSMLFAALGCTLGIVPHIMAGILGISAVLNTSAQLFRVIRIIGVLYLLYLGIGLIRSQGGLEVGEGQVEKPFPIMGKAVLINLLNPKLTLFFLSFLPQFINPHGLNSPIQMVYLSLIFMILTLLVFIVYGLAANSFKRFFKEYPQRVKRIQQGFGLVIIGFAAKLALDD